MAKARTPNQKKAYDGLAKRLVRYVAMVRTIYDTLNLEASKIALRTDFDSSGDKPFKFSDYPQTTKAIKDLQSSFVSRMGSLIMTSTSEEWQRSNEFCDLLANKVLKAYGGKRKGRYYQVNNDALQAFQRRRDAEAMESSRGLQAWA